jgi:hypothetical protein
MALSLFQMVEPLSAENWSFRHLVPMIYITYLLGLLKARVRYGISSSINEDAQQ